MAIAAQWQTVVTNITSAVALYTTPTSAFAATAGTYAYQRDLIITSSGVSTLFVSCGPAAAGATTTGSFQIPPGGSVILTQCQVPNATVIWGVSSGTAAASIGFGTNVSYI